MRVLRRGGWLILWMAFAALPCRADVGPPITVTILEDPRPAEAGVIFEATFRIQAHQGLDLTNMYLVEDGNWLPQYLLSPPPGTALAADEFVDVAFGIEVIDPDASPLRFAVEVNGSAFTYGFSLSPRAFLEGDVEQPLMRVSAVSGEDPRGPDGQVQEAARGARNIRVHGRCVYTMPGNVDVPVDGMSVQVWDTNNGTVLGDKYLAGGTTNSNGYYDFTFYWPQSLDLDPDIVVKWRSENLNVSVRNPANKVLTWYTPTWNNYAGTDLDVGIMKPAVLEQQAYPHLLTLLVRARRWIQSDLGLAVNFVKAIRDDSKGPWYEAGQDMIHMDSDPAWDKGRVWDEVTIVHEYGHHLIANHGVGQWSGYCNSSPCETCEGCECFNNGPWGEEQPVDAWNEGFPTWLGIMVTAHQTKIYGVPVFTGFSMESLQAGSSCNGPSFYGDPARTEGFFVSFLNDVTDAANEDDPATPGFADVMTWTSYRIWEVMWLDQPLTPMEFLDALVARNYSDREAIWETARNNAYELDLQKPGAPMLLTSTSHTVGVSSADGTVDLSWVTAADDMSGIGAYSLVVSPVGPQLPDTTAELGDVTQYTTSPLSPGNYWVSLRAQDRSGKWSDSYASIGPFVIAAPLTAEISNQPPPNWVASVVPQPLGNSSPTVMPAPPELLGDAPTWWNLGITNRGTGTSGAFESALRVDGIVRGTVASAPLRAGESFTAVNLGPVTVTGGRHTFECWLDAQEVLAESNEADNFWAKQWIWNPAPIPNGTSTTFPAPPNRTAGWSSIPGDPLFFNVNGHRVSLPTGFHAVTLHALEPDDYDLELHDPTAGPLRGFDTYRGWSSRLANELDAVILHNDLGVAQEYDVGVSNYSRGASSYVIGHVESQDLPFGGTIPVTFDPGEMLKLFTVQVPEEQTGYTSVRVQMDPAQGMLWSGWRDAAFTVGGLFDGQVAETASDGAARLDLLVESAGTYVLALWRDPASGFQGMTAELETGPTAPDIAPDVPVGWYSALVPAPSPDGTPSSVPEPATLQGDISTTWFNLAVINQSPTPMPASTTELHLDATLLGSWTWPMLAGGASDVANSTNPGVVRGGRHTLWAMHDAPSETPELDESGNVIGEQWIWAPQVLLPTGPVLLSFPPNPVIGWEALSDPGEMWFNADGMRLNVVPDSRARTGMWAAMAILPGASSDYDLQLHEASSGAKSGFASPLTLSGWGTGQSDFVLVNFNRTAVREFDAGVYQTEGTQDYRMQSVASTFLGTNPLGIRGPFSLPSGHILQLHELWLDPGSYSIHLINDDQVIDYGMTLHPGNAAYLSKSARVPGAIAWMAPAGEDEWITAVIDQPRYLCLSVWRRDDGQLPQAGSYRIEIHDGLTASEPARPLQKTMLIGAYPNPFNPRTTILYSLHADEQVVLAIYDMAGRHVRTLVDGKQAAGEHHADWSGTDSEGRQVASGVYFCQLRAGTVAETKRMLLLK